jgi:hypothetical protein
VVIRAPWSRRRVVPQPTVDLLTRVLMRAVNGPAGVSSDCRRIAEAESAGKDPRPPRGRHPDRAPAGLAPPQARAHTAEIALKTPKALLPACRPCRALLWRSGTVRPVRCAARCARDGAEGAPGPPAECSGTPRSGGSPPFARCAGEPRLLRPSGDRGRSRARPRAHARERAALRSVRDRPPPRFFEVSFR